MNKLRQLLEERELILLDSAMGTELQRLGYKTRLPLWTAPANEEAPQLVKKIHTDNIDAGADIITTNTFRTIPWTYSEAGEIHKARELTEKAVELAMQSVEESGKKVLIAGSVSTLEDCYEPGAVPAEDILRREHFHQVDLLKSLGVDFILAETINTIREAAAIAEAVQSFSIPFISSFVTDGNGLLLSKEKLSDAIEAILPFGPEVIMLNCRPLGIIDEDLDVLASHYSGFKGLYANGCGHPHEELGWKFDEGYDPQEKYLKHAQQWMTIPGLKVIGGCCGTNPEYIRALCKTFTS